MPMIDHELSTDDAYVVAQEMLNCFCLSSPRIGPFATGSAVDREPQHARARPPRLALQQQPHAFAHTC